MKLIVLGDSHGDTATVKQLAALPADAVFHCGDSELNADDPLLKNVHIVRGNCDYDSNLPKTITAELNGTKIFAAHGHEHSVNRSLLALSYAAAEQQADIALFGHTHLYGAEMINGILFVNPGSTIQPRGGREATYAVIEIGNGYKVSFYTLDDNLVDEIIFMK